MTDDHSHRLRATDDIREGVRQGVRDALAADVDRTSAGTAARLTAAGVLGLGAAAAVVTLFSRGSPEHVDRLQLALCAVAWSGVLVIAFALILLRVGSRRLPLADAATLGVLGLGLAALLTFVCPDPRIMEWWMTTPLGRVAEAKLGVGASALCLGLCTALVSGAGASLFFAFRGRTLGGVHLPALLLFLMLWPAVVVQSLGGSASSFAAWSVGLAAGAWAGVALGLGISRLRLSGR
jgi:hypothetical protein